ncbi:MAG TPA: DUF6644 family protein [Xanthobacteraceae bacterium]|nr:DUF6644 family protein [Xanthobacteraceae bacterium]
MQALAQWLAATPASRGIAGALWLIPVLQAVHILAIAAVLSAVMLVDLRILQVAGRSQTMAETARRFVPWIWASLIVLAATGLLLIIGEPKRSLLNPAFQLKMLLLALAIAVTVAFQSSLRRNVASWRDGAPRGVMMSALAVLTFLLWCAIAVAGRWIAYLQVY